MDDFFETLRTKDNQACYGFKSVEYALDNPGAVKTLLISDNLFRSKNTEIRKTYVQLAERSEKNGVTVAVFSSLNPAGERLKQMTGVAAILRFPVHGLDDVEETDDETSSTDSSDEVQEQEEN